MADTRKYSEKPTLCNEVYYEDESLKIGMNRVQLVDILHGRTKTPSLVTIGRILSGLGYSLDVKSA